MQDDNTGPQHDTEFQEYCRSYCNENGLEIRASSLIDSTHMNNLVVPVFPCMSKRYTKNLKQRGSMKSISKQET